MRWDIFRRRKPQPLPQFVVNKSQLTEAIQLGAQQAARRELERQVGAQLPPGDQVHFDTRLVATSVDWGRITVCGRDVIFK